MSADGIYVLDAGGEVKCRFADCVDGFIYCDGCKIPCPRCQALDDCYDEVEITRPSLWARLKAWWEAL